MTGADAALPEGGHAVPQSSPARHHQAAPTEIKCRFYPETAVGGFTRVDGVIEFFTRVSALVTCESTVLEFGAGRGLGAEDPVTYRRRLRTLRGRVREVVGVDVDPAVMHNPMVDSASVIEPGQPLPFPDSTFDLVVSENTFEHIETPEFAAAELTRILKPGGWICARTPNRLGYIGLATTLVPNRLHASILRVVQPNRQAADIFPTYYRMNTTRQLRKQFPPSRFRSYIYAGNAEPAYFGRSAFAWRIALTLFRIIPSSLGASLFVFLRKHD